MLVGLVSLPALALVFCFYRALYALLSGYRRRGGRLLLRGDRLFLASQLLSGGAQSALLDSVLCLCLLLAAAAFLARLKGNPYLEGFTYGIRPVCVGVMLATCITMAPNYQVAGAVSPAAVAIGGVGLVLLVKFKWSVPKVIGAAAVLGLFGSRGGRRGEEAMGENGRTPRSYL